MASEIPDDTSTTAPAAEESSLNRFPRDPSEFDSDPRISFSKLDNKFILETEDGQEYEYDTALKRWILSVDDDLLQQQQEAYKVAGVDEQEESKQQLKRKRKSKDIAQKPKKPRVNTAVFVTSIPLDATFDEIRDVFSKCGVIAEEIDSGRPRIKMYTDEKGLFKGEALVVYFRPESVNLAIQMLDESNFRIGVIGPHGPMRVQPADFSFKSQQEAPAQITAREKQRIIRRTQKLNNKLADWDDTDPSSLPETNSRFEKVVILKHMFTLAELEEDPAAILDIKEDIRDECSKLGEVTNVVLYDKESEGVVSVRFTDPEAARQCVRVMDGRYFAGTRVEAYIFDGSERFKKSNEKRAALEDMAERGIEAEDQEERDRLDEFGTWLESSHVVENAAK
ncbi:hypothetical protein MPDQ_000317 [Monascus purpureus]|uniref:RRM domain-containing protein n=1 Tax=Monascus purpureus TaxID=5098 RepID=A0A507QQ60_MONPU|nr:hypothetical protein MPDQ_000317 [Monascus purpureus]BDD54716.1 hypothetical protein MAP00_000312 [Monascus purpureus]